MADELPVGTTVTDIYGIDWTFGPDGRWHDPTGRIQDQGTVPGPPCPHGDPYCPCQDGDPCHYEWSGDTPPLDCAHCLTAKVANLMVWWWGEQRGNQWTSGVSLSIDHFVRALQRHGHAIVTGPEYQRLRRTRQPHESFRFCDARFAESGR